MSRHPRKDQRAISAATLGDLLAELPPDPRAVVLPAAEVERLVLPFRAARPLQGIWEQVGRWLR